MLGGPIQASGVGDFGTKTGTKLDKQRIHQTLKIFVATDIFAAASLIGKGAKPMTATATDIATTTWKLDPAHSAAEFKVKHMMISNVKGSFSGLSGVLTEHKTDATLSSVEATIPIETVNTGDPQRDGHLKSADFFDVEKFPTMTFKSTAVKQNGEGEYSVTGDLTLHGVTKPVTFKVEGPSAPAKDPWGNMRIGLSAATKINRKDFGLAWNAALETGGFLVGDEVNLTLDVQFIQG
jgi:polyisoprenoid-binding protein YceI